jgi:hypothetical protein
MSIKLKNPAFVQITDNDITPRKISKLVVDLKTFSGTKTTMQNIGEVDSNNNPIDSPVTTPQGYVQGWANDEQGNRIEGYNFECEIEEMQGKDILKEIHLDLLGNVQLLNTHIEFELSSAFK